MGEDAMKREAREDEIVEMEKIVSDAMRNGAIGFSTSTFEGHNGANGVPMPSRFANKKEISSVTNDVDKQIPKPDVLDFEPDGIHSFDSEVKPFNNELSGKDNYIVDTLSKLPKVDYSNTEMGRKNQTILD